MSEVNNEDLALAIELLTPFVEDEREIFNESARRLRTIDALRTELERVTTQRDELVEALDDIAEMIDSSIDVPDCLLEYDVKRLLTRIKEQP